MNLLRLAFALVFGGIIAMFLVAALRAQAPQTVTLPSALTDAQNLKVENHLLKVRVAQLEAQIADLTARLQGVTLTEERAALLEELRKALGAPANAEFDWEKRVFKPVVAGNGDRGGDTR